MRRNKEGVLTLILLLISVAVIFGCGPYYASDESAGASQGFEPPAPWEKPGVGDKVGYYYYPQLKIYYNLEKKVYFYHHEGQWQVASQLPSDVKLSGRRVTLFMYEEEPFKWQSEVEEKYPPEPQ